MNKDRLLILILLLFTTIFGVSLFFTLKVTRTPATLRAIERDYKPGYFYISGDTQASVNVPLLVSFGIDSNNQLVNAVSLQVEYDPKYLEVVKVDTTQSFCQFYPENRFNNMQGTLSIQCGAPHPGFKGKGVVASVQFIPKNVSQTNIAVSDKSMILVSDGKGTNIFTKPLTHPLTVLNNI